MIRDEYFGLNCRYWQFWGREGIGMMTTLYVTTAPTPLPRVFTHWDDIEWSPEPRTANPTTAR